RLHLHHLLLGKLLEIVPAEIARHLIGRGHDGAAVARMRLDDLAGPFRVEQVGVALGRGLHHVGVIADDADPRAEAREGAVGVLALACITSGHVSGRGLSASSSAYPQKAVGRLAASEVGAYMYAARLSVPAALPPAPGAPASPTPVDAEIKPVPAPPRPPQPH